MIKKLTNCYNVESLANLLDTSYPDLSSFIYSNRPRYRKIRIQKKSNGERIILSPVKKLKKIQLKVKELLEPYYSPRPCAHGFIKTRGIVSNAQLHTNRKFILNVDIENFFGSITFGRILNLFKSTPFNFKHPIAVVLAHICCYKGILPSGAPTSPMLSNMIMYKLDRELLNLSRDNRCRYTRYVDDISFSFNQKKESLPSEIVTLTDDRKIIIGYKLDKIIEKNGFSLNNHKTRIQDRSERQVVTGLIVNKKVNIDRRFISKTKSMIHAINKHGVILAENEYFSKYHKGYISNRKKSKIKSNPGKVFIDIVKGRLNYIRSVRGVNCRVFRNLMYAFTASIGQPNDEYKKDWIDHISESIFFVENYYNIDSLSMGTSFYLKDIGIITNYHVIAPVDASNFEDKVNIIPWGVGNSEILASLKAFDETLDIAIMEPLSTGNLKPLIIHDNPSYRRGVDVKVLGFSGKNNQSKDERPSELNSELSINLRNSVHPIEL